MKKFIAVILCFVTAFAICACGKPANVPSESASPTESTAPESSKKPTDSTKPSTDKAESRTEYNSLEEINKAVGGNLCAPGVMGVTGNEYAVIENGDTKIAEYRFAVNGTEYTFRCADTEDDISDVRFADGNISTVSESTEGIEHLSDNSLKCARWFADGIQYVLIVNDGGQMEEDTFAGIAQEFVLNTKNEM